jgi:hypothetical protein
MGMRIFGALINEVPRIVQEFLDAPTSFDRFVAAGQGVSILFNYYIN